MSDDIKPDIWQLQSHFDIQGLVSALSSEDQGIRRRAAAALRTLGAVTALPALKAAFAAEDDPQTRHTIATAIEMLSDDTTAKEKDSPLSSLLAESAPATPAEPVQPPLIQRLITRLKTGTHDEIIEAAKELGELGDKLAVEPLVLIFNNSQMSIHVRLAVAEALLKLNSAPVEVALLANLRHTDWHIRRNGAAILGQLRADWAVQPLARALRDPHPVVRRTARAALKYIGTPESRKALAQAAQSTQTTPKVSPETPAGFDIKRPGQNNTPPPKQHSGLLGKHLNDGKEPPKQTTQLLDPTIPDRASLQKAKMEPTMPIGTDILRKLDELNFDDDDQGKKPDQDTP